MQFVEQSMSLYRDIRSQSRQALEQAREKGIHKVYIDGDGDIADICRLSCLEAGFQIADRPASEDVAVLEIEGKDLVLQMPDEQWQG
jgi:hypothetical protein